MLLLVWLLFFACIPTVMVWHDWPEASCWIGADTGGAKKVRGSAGLSSGFRRRRAKRQPHRQNESSEEGKECPD